MWRDLHAVTGAYVGVVMLFLAVSGMPWSGYWGAALNAWATEHDLGYPPGAWDTVPVSDLHLHEVVEETGWAVENSPVPESVPQAAAPIGLDRAVEIVRELGVLPGFELALPSTPEGVYSATLFPDDLGRQRILHLDQYSGTPLVDLAFAEYGNVAKAIEFGVNVHQGQEWGLLNQLLMAATCLGIVLMSVAAVVMWWKRRPRGRVGVPPLPSDRRVYLGLWAVAILVGLAFPLTGLGIVIMLAVDLLLIRAIPPLRRVFS